MNVKSQQLANRFREVILSGTWIANTNYKAQLENLDWEIAISHIGTLNSISLLAHHIHYYVNGIKNVLNGGDLEIRDKYSFDFEDITSQEEWDSFLARFWQDVESLAVLIEELPDGKLVESFVDEKYGTYQRNIDGMIEHSYYHLGQIVILKKMILSAS